MTGTDPPALSPVEHVNTQAQQRKMQRDLDDAARTRREAERYAAMIGPDPDAAEHRSALEANIRADFRSRRKPR